MNKTVIVTGAASGIGHACAKLLLELGSRVVAFDVQLEKMEKSFHKVDNLIIFGGDVSIEKDCINVVRNAAKNFGNLDGLIHCGAAHSSARWEELDVNEMNKILEVNITGSFQIARAAAIHMKKSKSGSIVHHDCLS